MPMVPTAKEVRKSQVPLPDHHMVLINFDARRVHNVHELEQLIHSIMASCGLQGTLHVLLVLDGEQRFYYEAFSAIGAERAIETFSEVFL